MLYTLRMLVNTLAKQVQGLYHKYGPTFCHFDFCMAKARGTQAINPGRVKNKLQYRLRNQG